jgi:hypothetical protein
MLSFRFSLLITILFFARFHPLFGGYFDFIFGLGNYHIDFHFLLLYLF